MLLNLHWLIPAAIALVLYFVIELPLWIFWLCLGLWLLVIIVFTFFIGWASDAANEPEVKKENKNPYSAERNPYAKKKSE